MSELTSLRRPGSGGAFASDDFAPGEPVGVTAIVGGSTVLVTGPAGER